MLCYSTLPFDILHHICSTVEADKATLRALSLVNRSTRVAAVPFLFSEIIFDRQWGAENLAWDGVAAAVAALLNNEAIMMAVRSFHFQPWVGNPEERPIPNEFFQLIFTLPHLSEVSIIPQMEYLTQVKAAFNAVEDTLPRPGAKALPAVRSLTISSPEWIFVGECCPNLSFLGVRGRTTGRWMGQDIDIDVARLGKVHPNLVGLHCAEPASTKVIQAIARNLPQLKDLALYGGISSYGDEDSGNGALDHVNAYSDFKHLESVALPDASEWDMGFYPPRCGNAYFSNPGLRDRVIQQEKDTTRRLMEGIYADVIMKKGATLRKVLVGPPYWHQQTLWEKGEDGKLFESKTIELCKRTRKVTKVTGINE